MPTPQEITRHHEPAADVEWVACGPTPGPVDVVPDDPSWPARCEEVAGRVRVALGDRALAMVHVGSASVPGLAANPVVREPGWHQHRCLTREQPGTNLPVLPPEVVRNTLFRDRLFRAHGLLP